MEFEVHWGQHPLRPELVESTYFLYEVQNKIDLSIVIQTRCLLMLTWDALLWWTTAAKNWA